MQLKFEKGAPKSPSILYFIYDPMCSWCWGYRPVWQMLQQQLQENLADKLQIRYCLGGLAPDNEQPMTEEMQQFLQQTWRQIETQLGTTFNFDFWSQCKPRRSTYLACRALLIARQAGREQAMYLGIQEAYYLKARNPSDIDTLIEIALAVGLDIDDFTQRINSAQLVEQLAAEISLCRTLPMQGFPSLVLCTAGNQISIPLDYHDWKTSYAAISAHL